MAEIDSLSREETDITVSVAMKTAFRVAAIFLVFYLLQRFADFASAVPPTIEATLRTMAVVLVSWGVAKREMKAHPNQDLSSDAFLSAVFFYGITLATVYAIQIGVLVFEIVGWGSMTFVEEMKFITGLHDFSTRGIVTTFILSHLPYLAYYLVVRNSK